MATVTSNAGSRQPDSLFYDVDVDNETTSNSTTYAWETLDFTGTNVNHTVTLLGNFSYNGFGDVSGSVAQILMDADGDGTNDLTIAYSTFVAGILPNLISGNLNSFFSAAFFQNDTITLSGSAQNGNLFALSGDISPTLPESDDDITITGFGAYAGDARFANGGRQGGDDDFTINADNANTAVTLYGDFSSADGVGGDDTFIDLTGAAATADFVGVFGAGDFQNGVATSEGGDDLFQGGVRAVRFSGDSDVVISNGSTLEGGNDTITGSTQDDLLYGEFRTNNSGNYTVDGGADSILGGAGNDEIFGEGDVFTGGNVTLLGGNDTLRGGDGNDTIHGGSGIDSIFGDDGDDLLIGGSGVDFFNGGDGSDTADYSANFFALNVQLNNGAVASSVSSGGIAESLFFVENIIGTNANDTFAGNDDSNTFEGGGGNDTMDGEGGTDIASYVNATSAVTVDLSLSGVLQAIGGGQGSDLLESVEGVIGSGFNDTIFGSFTNDSIQGGAGDDILLTRSSNSFTQSGTDTIDGGFGDDTIGFGLTGFGQSSLGLDHAFDGGATFFGSQGDTFTFEPFSGSYTVVINGDIGGSFTRISDGTQFATLDRFDNVIAGEGNDVITNTSALGRFIDGNGGNDSITHSAFAEYTLNGGTGDDTITGGILGDTLNGGDNNDLLFGNDGDDLINGGSGNDTIDGESGPDIVNGGLGDDRIIMNFDSANQIGDMADGGDDNDTAVFNHWDSEYEVSSLGGIVTVTSDSGAFSSNLTDFEVFQVGDIILDEAGLVAANFIFAVPGDDTLVGTSGADVLVGDTEISPTSGTFDTNLLQGLGGNDYLLGSNGSDTLVGGAGADTMNGGGGDDTADYSTSTERVEINLTDGTGTSGHATGDELDSIENIIGSDFNDLLQGGLDDNTIDGGAGGDNISGRSGEDMLFGGEGTDLVSGGLDDDTLDGGIGNDTLRGNGGDDSIVGGQGEEDIFGGVGDDFIDAGTENDSVLGQGNNDTILGDAGNDTIRGGSGNDSIEGGDDDDDLFGNGNNDTIHGGEGNDSIQGNAGSDRLFGGDGDDTLFSGIGGDRLDGGEGDDLLNGGTLDNVRDVFVFMVGYDEDRINQFDQTGTDRLELDASLWDSTNPGLTAQEAIDMFGSVNGNGTILTLDFGGTDILEVQSSVGITQSTFGLDVLLI